MSSRTSQHTESSPIAQASKRGTGQADYTGPTRPAYEEYRRAGGLQADKAKTGPTPQAPHDNHQEPTRQMKRRPPCRKSKSTRGQESSEPGQPKPAAKRVKKTVTAPRQTPVDAQWAWQHTKAEQARQRKVDLHSTPSLTALVGRSGHHQLTALHQSLTANQGQR